MLQVRLECCRHAWNTEGAPGIRQVRLGIIATTYHSTIVKTQVFWLYSHLCIKVSIYLYSYPSTLGISALASGGAWEQFQVHLKITIQWTEIFDLGPWSIQFGDTLRDYDRVNLEMHSEIVIEQVRRCTWRPWLCELGDSNRATSEIHLQAVIERV